ncbi:hypothetical protein DICVIV_12592 [Dictyocaulus viviparus]|uniref:Uncharacterized protein n=1 Tax=Dictyocaulus viviparus TaxID=29172 RepID=A0A0D8XGC6_DICVI|nr:hypothetical protein DICVIV_12592 [Dictyocaulus viviparus]
MNLLTIIALLNFSIYLDAQLVLPKINVHDSLPASLSLSPFYTVWSKLFSNFTNLFSTPDWEKDLEKQIMETFDKAMQITGIETINGSTKITQTIGGKKFTKSLPPGTSYTLSSTKVETNGNVREVVSITVNGTTSVYNTTDGITIVTDGKGKVLNDGGIFGFKQAAYAKKIYEKNYIH